MPQQLTGTFATTPGSSGVPSTISQVGVVAPGDQVTFGTQLLNVTYGVKSVSPGGLVLSSNYTGPGAATDLAVDLTIAPSKPQFGLTPGGFNAKPQTEIQTDITNNMSAQTGQVIDASAGNEFGKTIGVFSGALAELWQVAASCYSGIDRDQASAAQLDNVGGVTNALRQAPTASTVLCSVTLPAGTYVAGSLVASVLAPVPPPSPLPLATVGAQFRNTNPVTSVGPRALIPATGFTTVNGSPNVATTSSQVSTVQPGDQVTFGSQSGVNYRVAAVTGAQITLTGNYTGSGSASDSCTDLSTSGVAFAAVTTGPVLAPAGWLTNVAAPVTGWTDIYNASTATPGVNLQADPDYRATQSAQFALSGGSTSPSLQSQFYALFAGPGFNLTGASANVVDSPSTRTFAVYVYPGTVAGGFTPAQLTAIAQTIWNNKPAGITPTGTTSQTIFDSQNIQRSVAFSLVTVLPVYLKITVAFTPSVSSAGTQGTVAAAIKNAIATQSQGVTVAGDLLAQGTQGVLVPGGSVFSEPIGSAALSVTGVGSVRKILLGLSNPPTLTNDIWGANDAAIQAAVDPTNAVQIAANQVGGISTTNIQVIDATGASGPF